MKRFAAIALTLLASTFSGQSFIQAEETSEPVPLIPDTAPCLEKIAFIDVSGSIWDGEWGLLAMTNPILDAQDLLWGSAVPIRFEFIDLASSDQADIDAAVDGIEARVEELKAAGYKRIGLPPLSLVTGPFILGTAGTLGGVNVDTRHPEVVFVTMNSGTPAVNEAVRVFRVLDVNSWDVFQESSVADLLGPGGSLLVLHQASDPFSESIRDIYLGIGASLSVTTSAVAVSFDGLNFNFTAAAPAVNALPAGSLVVHIANFTEVDEWTTDALSNAGIFVGASASGAIEHFAGNYFPTQVLPVDVHTGIDTVDSSPSLEMAAVGFPLTPDDWALEPRNYHYIEAYGWLANRGDFNGVLDHHLRFDEFGTRIAYEVVDGLYAAGTQDYTTMNRRVNPRWLASTYEWSWDFVFGACLAPDALPVPMRPDLDVLSDTGSSNSDDVTSDSTPTMTVFADLSEQASQLIPILNASQVPAAGAAVEVLVSNVVTGATTTGFADRIGTSVMFFTFTPSSSLPAGLYSVAARVTLFENSSGDIETMSVFSNPLLITIAAEPVAQAGADQTTGIFTEIIQLGGSPSATGGTPPYLYSWALTPSSGLALSSTAAPNPTFNGTQLGSYVAHLTVTDALGFSDTDEATIETCALPQLELSGTLLNGVQVFPAVNTITLENLTVMSAATTTFVAGDLVTLGEGVSIESGAVVEIRLAPVSSCSP